MPGRLNSNCELLSSFYSCGYLDRGRIGFELVQKAAVSGMGAIAAIGAPSSLAVRLAEETGLGLVGFVSRRRFVVYAEPSSGV